MLKKIFLGLIGLFLVLFLIFLFLKKEEKSYNLLFITLDTLRADHLGCYGYKKGNTKNIDMIAKEGVLFTKTFAQSSLTFPSHTSILTGTNPTYHGIKDNSFFRLNDKIPTLATILQSYRYQTGAVVSGATLARRKGLSRGFYEYDDVSDNTAGYGYEHRHITERIAEKSVSLAIKQLQRFMDTPSKPFFLWLHLFDPHAEYNPPSPFKERFRNASYDGEIAYLDHCLGKIFALLKKRKKYENTIIVIMADHGEGLGEHGEASHGYFIYNSTIHIPLMMRIPHLKKKGRVISEVVSSIDVMPTVLSLLEIKDHGKAQGRDLAKYILNEKEKFEKRESYAETFFTYHSFGWDVIRSITFENYKYISIKGGELYNLKNDFSEKNNLLANNPSKKNLVMAEKLKKMLLAYTEKDSIYALAEENSEDLKKIQSLGYPGMYSPSGKAKRGRILSSKKMGTLIQLFIKGQTYLALKRDKEAINIFYQILQQDPKNTAAIALLGKLYSRQNKLNKSLYYYQYLRKLNPGLKGPKQAVLDILMLKKSFVEAEKLMLDIIEENEEDAIVCSRFAYLKLHFKKYNEAIRWAQKATFLQPSLPSSWFYLGLAYKGKKEFSKAVSVFQKAMRVKKNWSEAQYHYATSLWLSGNKVKGKKLLKSLLKKTPKNGSLYKDIEDFLRQK